MRSFAMPTSAILAVYKFLINLNHTSSEKKKSFRIWFLHNTEPSFRAFQQVCMRFLLHSTTGDTAYFSTKRS
jgi:hypothetical protein